jgi:hypothetical protein
VLAVDAAPGEPRDETMAVRLGNAAQDRPVLALLGNIHALRHVEWEPPVDDNPTAAELLVLVVGWQCSRCFRTGPGECGDREPVLRKPRHPGGQAAVAEVFAPMAVRVPDDSASAADRVVVWECR